ncbi:MAG: TetR/AcrR family transcriptional regulator, cholesterol catabolism regulator [Pseudonocardiales bacterium]|jgi:AcrR family transcriptional regulator|nr:TetR/AcrR family transcriptional regulator, cholesterol catabolism regulator [Pseudonocardiales bacterium]MDT7620675.1 TetR/AcrR family transcriptional regulator, cholesterol catabolism regulator [Pseudonocardiales bacterium]
MARERATDTTALVAAAAEVFRVRGYHNATIDDIAEAAGISRPTVYKYTKSKQHLLDLMVDQVTQDMGRRMQAVIHSTDDPTERLRRVVRAHVEAAVANRTFYAIVLSEEVEVSDAGREQFRKWARGVTAEFQELVEECLRAQRNPPKVDPFIVANLVLSMLTSLYRWYDPTGPASPERLTDEILLVIGNLLP